MKPNAPPEEVEATAYHEAGHAVADVLTGQRFRYVTLRPRGGAWGHVMPAGPYSLCRWLDCAASTFGGLIAEDLYWHEGCSDPRTREAGRQVMVREGSAADLRLVRGAVRAAWSYHHNDPAFVSATPIAPGWTPLEMAKAAWERAVWLVVGAADALGELARVLMDSPRAVTWRQACDVVGDCGPVAVSAAELVTHDLLRPWFLDHSRLRWNAQPRVAARRAVAVAARGGDDD